MLEVVDTLDQSPPDTRSSLTLQALDVQAQYFAAGDDPYMRRTATDAAGLLLKSVSNTVQRHASRYSGSGPFDSDDVYQRTMLRVWMALEKGQFQGNGDLEAWIGVIAKHEAHRVFSEKPNKTVQDGDVGFDSLYDVASDEDVAANTVERITSRDRLVNALSGLSENDKKLLMLAAAGVAMTAIAATLGISYNNTKMRKSRATNLARKNLESSSDS